MDKQELETPLGKVWITVTSGTHIFVSAANKQYGETPITVFGVDYHLAGHLYKYSDGKFEFGVEGNRESQLYEPYMSRVGGFGEGPSRAAKAKVRRMLPEFITEWVTEHEKEMGEAKLADLKEKVERARLVVSDKAKELEAAKETFRKYGEEYLKAKYPE